MRPQSNETRLDLAHWIGGHHWVGGSWGIGGEPPLLYQTVENNKGVTGAKRSQWRYTGSWLMRCLLGTKEIDWIRGMLSPNSQSVTIMARKDISVTQQQCCSLKLAVGLYVFVWVSGQRVPIIKFKWIELPLVDMYDVCLDPERNQQLYNNWK